MDFTAQFLGALNDFGAWLWNSFIAVFSALWDMLTDFVCWIFDQCLGLAVSIVGGLDVSGVTDQLGWFDAIPSDMFAVLSACGVGSALGIISSALVIRFFLQLIPFTRLGS